MTKTQYLIQNYKRKNIVFVVIEKKDFQDYLGKNPANPENLNKILVIYKK